MFRYINKKYFNSKHSPTKLCPPSALSRSAEFPRHPILLSLGSLPDFCASKNIEDRWRACS